ncbi:MAG TPA: hypothetical protein VK540_34295 [Polyangiaceae bacterium]|nr:hypothetical protein [Polyangiaceae bacterium]
MIDKISALLAALFACLLVSGRVCAKDEAPPISIVSDPTTIIVPYREHQGAGRIRVVVQSAMSSITLRSRPCKLGDRYATVAFEANSKDWFDLDATTARTVEIPIVIHDLAGVGLYEGAIEALLPSGSVVSAKLVVVRTDAGFSPVIVSDALKNGRIEFTGKNEDQFVLGIQNPTTAIERTFMISVLGPHVDAISEKESESSTPGTIAIKPDSVHLLPGQEQPVFATLRGAAGVGTPYQAIRVAAKDDPTLFKDTLVAIKDAGADDRRLLHLLFIVLIGAVLSLVISNVFPSTFAKAKHRMTLTQAEAAIRSCVNISGFAQASLLAEAGSLRLAVGEIKWYQPSKTEQLPHVDRAIGVLKCRLECAQAINSLRTQVQQANLLPITAEYQIEEKLYQAEEAMVDGQLDAAKGRRDEAIQLRAGSTAPTAIAALRTKLANDIAALLKRPAPSGRDAQATVRIDQLRTAAADIPTTAEATLLETERDYNVIWTYINVGESALERNAGRPDIAQSAAQLFELLKANPASARVGWLCKLIDADVSLQQIATAVGAKQGTIVCNPNPRLCELCDYRFEFTDPRLAAVSATLRLTKFRWNFKDGTTPADYDRCKHFYTKNALRSDSATRVRWWSERPFRRDVDVEVQVTPLVGEGDVTFSQKVFVTKPRDRGWGLIGMQVISFLVTSLVAVLAAFGAQYVNIPAALTVSSGTTAFLFGFSLDQLRSKTTG